MASGADTQTHPHRNNLKKPGARRPAAGARAWFKKQANACMDINNYRLWAAFRRSRAPYIGSKMRASFIHAAI